MMKQKQVIAAVLVCCIFIAAILASIFVLKLSKSFTDTQQIGKSLASFEQFHVIAHDLDERGDLQAECKAQLGNGMRLADWNDIVAFYELNGSLDDFVKGLKMSIREDMLEFLNKTNEKSEGKTDNDEKQLIPYTPGSGYRITFNGEPRYMGANRHFFVARHDHIMPPGFLAHDQLNNYQLTVGSWYGKGGYALCYGSQLGIPIALSKALKSTMSIVAYLLVGCLMLFAAFLSIHILRIPNWLIGRNLEVIKQSIEMKKNEIVGLEQLQASITNGEDGESIDDVDTESNK